MVNPLNMAVEKAIAFQASITAFSKIQLGMAILFDVSLTANSFYIKKWPFPMASF